MASRKPAALSVARTGAFDQAIVVAHNDALPLIRAVSAKLSLRARLAPQPVLTVLRRAAAR